MDPDNGLTFDALADPTRREILLLLAESEKSVGELNGRLDHVSQTALSGHLRILRSADLVAYRRAGRFRHYSINPAPAAAIAQFFTSVYSAAFRDLTSAASGAPDNYGEDAQTGSA